MFQPTPHNDVVALQKQGRKAQRPIMQITIGKRADMRFHVIRHILIVIFLVAQGSQKIEHFGARIFTLFAERVDKSPVETFEEVCAEDLGSGGFEDLQVERGRLARFPFKMVRDVNEEVESFLGRPEEWVDHDGCGIRSISARMFSDETGSSELHELAHLLRGL